MRVLMVNSVLNVKFSLFLPCFLSFLLLETKIFFPFFSQIDWWFNHSVSVSTELSKNFRSLFILSIFQVHFKDFSKKKDLYIKIFIMYRRRKKTIKIFLKNNSCSLRFFSPRLFPLCIPHFCYWKEIIITTTLLKVIL